MKSRKSFDSEQHSVINKIMKSPELVAKVLLLLTKFNYSKKKKKDENVTFIYASLYWDEEDEWSQNWREFKFFQHKVGF